MTNAIKYCISLLNLYNDSVKYCNSMINYCSDKCYSIFETSTYFNVCHCNCIVNQSNYDLYCVDLVSTEAKAFTLTLLITVLIFICCICSAYCYMNKYRITTYLDNNNIANTHNFDNYNNSLPNYTLSNDALINYTYYNIQPNNNSLDETNTENLNSYNHNHNIDNYIMIKPEDSPPIYNSNNSNNSNNNYSFNDNATLPKY